MAVYTAWMLQAGCHARCCTAVRDHSLGVPLASGLAPNTTLSASSAGQYNALHPLMLSAVLLSSTAGLVRSVCWLVPLAVHTGYGSSWS